MYIVWMSIIIWNHFAIVGYFEVYNFLLLQTLLWCILLLLFHLWLLKLQVVKIIYKQNSRWICTSAILLFSFTWYILIFSFVSFVTNESVCYWQDGCMNTVTSSHKVLISWKKKIHFISKFRLLYCQPKLFDKCKDWKLQKDFLRTYSAWVH